MLLASRILELQDYRNVPTQVQWYQIKEHLQTVFNKVTSDVVPPMTVEAFENQTEEALKENTLEKQLVDAAMSVDISTLTETLSFRNHNSNLIC